MVKAVKCITEIQNLYTYFEFSGLERWDDYDALFSIFDISPEYDILNHYDAIYSRRCYLEKDSFFFQLLYHEDIGNCLFNHIRQDEAYYTHLETIANDVVAKLQI